MEKTIEIKKIISVGTTVTENSSDMYIETNQGRISTDMIKKIIIEDKNAR